MSVEEQSPSCGCGDNGKLCMAALRSDLVPIHSVVAHGDATSGQKWYAVIVFILV